MDNKDHKETQVHRGARVPGDPQDSQDSRDHKASLVTPALRDCLVNLGSLARRELPAVKVPQDPPDHRGKQASQAEASRGLAGRRGPQDRRAQRDRLAHKGHQATLASRASQASLANQVSRIEY